MHRLRYRPWILPLSAVLLALQVLLPVLHAQAMAAAMAKDPWLAALCGRASPVLIQKLREIAPPEILRQIDPNRSSLSQFECPVCVVGGNGAAPLPVQSVAIVQFLPLPPAVASGRRVFVPRTAALPPPSQGPPLYS
ncbi:MAG: hypothetical protein L0Y32_00775 [Nevskiales bacterium]|nr:hypothetical protein [Nevskiales bacterium]